MVKLVIRVDLDSSVREVDTLVQGLLSGDLTFEDIINIEEDDVAIEVTELEDAA